MSSREIRDLSPTMQVLYNKFYDRCRRDVELLKSGVSVLLICTYRSKEEQAKISGGGSGKCKFSTTTPDGKPSSSAFDVILLRYGVPLPSTAYAWELVCTHATEVGLKREFDGFREA